MPLSSKMPHWKILKAREMRKNMTTAEAQMYYRLKERLAVRVRRQMPMLGYIADIYIPKAKLVIEVDGASHTGRGAYDARRDAHLAEHGIMTLRYWNWQVIKTLGRVLNEIEQEVDKRLALPKPRRPRKRI